MNFQARLEERIAKCGNPICLGMDPVTITSYGQSASSLRFTQYITFRG